MKRTLCALALLCACGTDTSPPFLFFNSTQPTASPFGLQWVPAAGETSQYVVESKIGDAPFSDALTQPAGQAFAALVEVDAVIEDTTVSFRVRADPGARVSNIVSAAIPVNPPTIDSVSTNASGAFVVAWSNHSRLSKQVPLERRVVPAVGAAGDFQQVAIGTAATNVYVETDMSGFVDGAHYEYRAKALAPSGTASTVAASSTPSAVLSTAQFTATLDAAAGTVKIVIHNPSAKPQTLHVDRFGFQAGSSRSELPVETDVAAGATVTVTDTLLAPDVYRYSLSTLSGSGGNFSIGEALAEAFVIFEPSGGNLLPGAPVQGVPVLNATRLVRNDAGAFGAVVGRSVIPPGGASADTLVVPQPDLQAFSFVIPLVLDAQGRPHTIYRDFSTDTNGAEPSFVTHAVFDGGAWHTERIASGIIDFFNVDVPVALDAGLDGTLFAAFVGDSTGEHFATLGPSGWSLEQFPPGRGQCSVTLDGASVIAGDENGQPHVFYVDVNFDFSSFDFHTLHAFKSASAASGWQTEQLPSGLSFCDNGQVVASPGKLTFLSYRFPTISVAERTSAGWGPVETLTTARASRVLLSRSKDGSTVVIADDVGEVWIRRGGTETSASYLVTSSSAGMGAGVSANGKVWVAAPLESALTNGVEGILFEEK